MKNALAVYCSRSPMNGRRLVDFARKNGLHLRIMLLGGYLPADPVQIQKKSLATVNGGGLLITGVGDDAAPSLADFDRLVELADRQAIAELLNDGRPPWCELYTSGFNYEKTVETKPRDQPGIDGSFQADELPILKAAKTRYIIYNQSRSKNGQQLMKDLANCIAAQHQGIVANYKRPTP
ncbi:MAG: hypothetical protein R3C49_25965 [Planctomycetaceae bacterium]